MKRYGLIGYPLTHSFSKKYFEDKFRNENISDCIYENFPLTNIDQFPSLIQSNAGLIGLNVTIPYKELVIPYLDELHEAAKEIGAVNTIKVSKGRLHGYNTDAFGFMQSLMKELKPHHTRALILGTGGSSKAVAYGLKKMGIEYQFVSRQPESNREISYGYLDKEVIREHTLIVNTTPTGMFPNVEVCPSIPYEYLTSYHLLFDLIYNPSETMFLKKGQAQFAKIKNGLEMLQLQAERSWEIWNGG